MSLEHIASAILTATLLLLAGTGHVITVGPILGAHPLSLHSPRKEI